jgi:hypothetical protein
MLQSLQKKRTKSVAGKLFDQFKNFIFAELIKIKWINFL